MESLKKPRIKGPIIRLTLLLLALFLQTTHCEANVYSDIVDHPQKCNFTKLMCNESRLLEEDKIIILNIANEMRNRVADGSFSYLNLRHDPVSNMNKLSWSEELEKKSATLVSSCPERSSSFISQETDIVSGMDGIDYIKIHNTFDPLNDEGGEIPGCEVSTITYQEKLTLCAPQKIKERLIGYLTEGGLSAEARKYDMRDFWMVTRYGEPRLTFRRAESTNLGCSYLIRAGETHYHSYLTCIYCVYNSTLPMIGHPGEACSKNHQHFDEKYENLCSDLENEYGSIKKDHNLVVCRQAEKNVTVTPTPLEPEGGKSTTERNTPTSYNTTSSDEIITSSQTDSATTMDTKSLDHTPTPLAPEGGKTTTERNTSSSDEIITSSQMDTKSLDRLCNGTGDSEALAPMCKKTQSTSTQRPPSVSPIITKSRPCRITTIKAFSTFDKPYKTLSTSIITHYPNTSIMESTTKRQLLQSTKQISNSSSSTTQKFSISKWPIKSSTPQPMKLCNKTQSVSENISRITKPQPEAKNKSEIETYSRIKITTAPPFTISSTCRKTTTASTFKHSNLISTTISSIARKKLSTREKITSTLSSSITQKFSISKWPIKSSTMQPMNRCNKTQSISEKISRITKPQPEAKNKSEIETYSRIKIATAPPFTISSTCRKTTTASTFKHSNLISTAISSIARKKLSTREKITSTLSSSITQKFSISKWPIKSSTMQPMKRCNKTQSISEKISRITKPQPEAKNKSEIETYSRIGFATSPLFTIFSTCRKTTTASTFKYSNRMFTAISSLARKKLSTREKTTSTTLTSIGDIFQNKTSLPRHSISEENITQPTRTEKFNTTATTPISTKMKKTKLGTTAEAQNDKISLTTSLSQKQSTSSDETRPGTKFNTITARPMPIANEKMTTFSSSPFIAPKTAFTHLSRNETTFTPTEIKYTCRRITTPLSTTYIVPTITPLNLRVKNISSTTISSSSSTRLITSKIKSTDFTAKNITSSYISIKTIFPITTTCRKTTPSSSTKHIFTLAPVTIGSPSTTPTKFHSTRPTSRKTGSFSQFTSIISSTISPCYPASKAKYSTGSITSFFTNSTVTSGITPLTMESTSKNNIQRISTIKCQKPKSTLSQYKENSTTRVLPIITHTPIISTKLINIPYNTTTQPTTSLHFSKLTCKKIMSTTAKKIGTMTFIATTTTTPSTTKCTRFIVKNTTSSTTSNLTIKTQPNNTLTESQMTKVKTLSTFPKLINIPYNTTIKPITISYPFKPKCKKTTPKSTTEKNITASTATTTAVPITTKSSQFRFKNATLSITLDLKETTIPNFSVTNSSLSSINTASSFSNTTVSIRTSAPGSFKSRSTCRKSSTTSTTKLIDINSTATGKTSTVNESNTISRSFGVPENYRTASHSITKTVTHFTTHPKLNTTSPKILPSIANTLYSPKSKTEYSEITILTFSKTPPATHTNLTVKPEPKKHATLPTSISNPSISTFISSFYTKPFKTTSMITSKYNVSWSLSFGKNCSSAAPTKMISEKKSQNQTTEKFKKLKSTIPISSKTELDTVMLTSLRDPCKVTGNQGMTPSMTITAAKSSKASLTKSTTTPIAFEKENMTKGVPQTLKKPDFRQRQCVCINWYMIGLIFIIAFLFAWCLICWQRVLLF